MAGTEILPVSAVRTCDYADGCDEVAMPGSTCCWRHRRAGKLFPAQTVPASRTARITELKRAEKSTVADEGKCGCGRPANHYGRCAYRRENPGVQSKRPAHAIQVSTETRDALNGSAGDDDSKEVAVFSVKMTEPMLDTLWGLLDGQRKADLLSKIGQTP